MKYRSLMFGTMFVGALLQPVDRRDVIMAHASVGSLKEKLNSIPVAVGDIYYHYRNPKTLYKIIGVGLQEATEDTCIIYQNMNDPALIWVRNLTSWLLPAEHEGKKVQRFIKVD